MMPRLTDTLVKSLQAPEGKTELKVYDDQVRGFGVRVTTGGSRSFFLNYVIAGRERRFTFAQYPAWGVAAARARAAMLRRRADAGEDPQAERVALRAAKTLGDLKIRYAEEVATSKAQSTAEDEETIWQNLVLPELGRKRLAEISFSDVEKLHRTVSKSTPVRANRMLALLRHAFNKAIQWGWVEINPVNGIKRNAELPRERYLSRDELEAFFAAMDARQDTPSLLAIRFILLTGCRRGEALSARWEQFDLNTGHWTKPSAHTKQRRVHRVPLSSEAVATLRRARLLSNGDVVFPGPSGSPLVEVKRIFKLLLQEAGIRDLRIHDLRHSFASILASGGKPLNVIGRLLGHTQPVTTMRYAHLFDEPLREASEVMSMASKQRRAVSRGEEGE
jgi:integrase